MTLSSDVTTTVVDAGARYGMHPSWRPFQGPLRYLAFEPDPEEAARLRTAVADSRFEVIETALDRSEGERPFHLLKHRGLSSFLKPDPDSECFRRLKPGQAEIERVVTLATRTLDSVLGELSAPADFLKVDTEGTEHDVLVGGAGQLDSSVLGVRASCNFQPCFFDQILFSTTHDYLLDKGFVLLNLDYQGYGYPRLGLFRKPDPIQAEDFRYGVLVAADAVWIRTPGWIAAHAQMPEAGDVAILKLAYFCILNNAPDVGIDLLKEHAESRARPFADVVVTSRLFRALKLEIANFLGRWRTVPDQQWDQARTVFQTIFDQPLGGGSDFYPQVQAMEAGLREG